MTVDDDTGRDPTEEEVPAGPTGEQEVASGRPAWTPAVVLGSVALTVGALVAIVLVLALVAYFLA